MADDDFITPHELQTGIPSALATEFFKNNHGDFKPCPVCESPEYSYIGSPENVLLLEETSGMVGPGADPVAVRLPVFKVYCTNCGLVRSFFAAPLFKWLRTFGKGGGGG